MNEFESRVNAVDPEANRAMGVKVLQLNLGLACNMTCTHCHHESSPQRNETMEGEVFASALGLARRYLPDLIDITGGSPELHPRIREMMVSLRYAGFTVQLRTNLSVLAEPGCEDLPVLLADCGVRVLASLPSADPSVYERQRGKETFPISIKMLRYLNDLGYATTSGLRLDIASNPHGPYLPDSRVKHENELRRELRETYGVQFDRLCVLTNMPLGRFRRKLEAEGTRREYLEMLRSAFNPATVPRLACRETLAVDWEGTLYDCDFNVAAGLPIRSKHRTVFDCDPEIEARQIAFGPHCFGCTARSGSS